MTIRYTGNGAYGYANNTSLSTALDVLGLECLDEEREGTAEGALGYMPQHAQLSGNLT